MAEATLSKALADLTPGMFVTITKTRPVGALQARKQNTGVTAFYWRYSIGVKSERVAIGLYDPSAPPRSLAPTSRGYSFAAAVRAAETMALEHHAHREQGGRPAIVEARREAKRMQLEAANAAAESKKQAERHTLDNLLTDYCDHLEVIGRRSHKDARSIFNLHVRKAWPELAAMPAKDVTGEHFADMMRALGVADKRRTANKLRSYARAAYQTAKAAKSRSTVPAAFKGYGIVHNPVADTEPDEAANKPDKKPLTARELGTYWRAVRAQLGFKGALLRLHILTGGQRIEQLLNLLTSDVKADSIVLYDGKGRPGRAPREHTIPLIKEAGKALEECKPVGKFALSTDGGMTHVAATSLSAWAVEIAGSLIPKFQAKRIRSGIETLLASAAVSKETRGHLQSHGVAGVQTRHYDGHEYLTEKRKALMTLHKMLERLAEATDSGPKI